MRLRELLDPVGLSVPSWALGMLLTLMSFEDIGRGNALGWYAYHGMSALAGAALMVYAIVFVNTKRELSEQSKGRREAEAAVRILAQRLALSDDEVGRALYLAKIEVCQPDSAGR